MKKFIAILLFIILICGCAIATYASAPYLSYTPYYGYVNFYVSNNERYARIQILWNDSGVSEFESENDTYEQELIFYNYTESAYATYCSSYQTNVPNPYLDTQVLDPPSEANIAIGTTAANELTAGTPYYYVYNLKGSNGVQSMYKICSQEGHYILLPSTWTTFAETAGVLIPFNNGYFAPESRAWNTEVEPNNTISAANSRISGRWQSGTISTASDVDYLKIYGGATRTIKFYSPSGTDYDVDIYDSNGNLITGLYQASNEDSLTYTFGEGYYYFMVYSYEGYSDIAPYRLIVEAH